MICLPSIPFPTPSLVTCPPACLPLCLPCLPASLPAGVSLCHPDGCGPRCACAVAGAHPRRLPSASGAGQCARQVPLPAGACQWRCVRCGAPWLHPSHPLSTVLPLLLLPRSGCCRRVFEPIQISLRHSKVTGGQGTAGRRGRKGRLGDAGKACRAIGREPWATAACEQIMTACRAAGHGCARPPTGCPDNQQFAFISCPRRRRPRRPAALPAQQPRQPAPQPRPGSQQRWRRRGRRPCCQPWRGASAEGAHCHALPPLLPKWPSHPPAQQPLATHMRRLFTCAAKHRSPPATPPHLPTGLCPPAPCLPQVPEVLANMDSREFEVLVDVVSMLQSPGPGPEVVGAEAQLLAGGRRAWGGGQMPQLTPRWDWVCKWAVERDSWRTRCSGGCPDNLSPLVCPLLCLLQSWRERKSRRRVGCMPCCASSSLSCARPPFR